MRLKPSAALSDKSADGPAKSRPAGRILQQEERRLDTMWNCPKCGRAFTNTCQSHFCAKAPETVEEYILAQDESVRDQLQSIRAVLRRTLPDAEEKISWSMPTYRQEHNIIHFAAQKKHIGLYPGPEAVVHFAEKLDQAGCKYSKGSIRIPYREDLPLPLVAEIAAWCLETGNHA